MVPPPALEAIWVDAAYSQTREFLRGLPRSDEEMVRKKAKITVLRPCHEVAYVHSQRSFLGVPHADWLVARAQPGQAARAQPCDCVPQRTRRSSEMDPTNSRAPRRYTG